MGIRRPKNVLSLDLNIIQVNCQADKITVYFNDQMDQADLNEFCENYLVKLQRRVDDEIFSYFWAEPVCCLQFFIKENCIQLRLNESIIETGMKIYFYTLHNDLTFGSEYLIS